MSNIPRAPTYSVNGGYTRSCASTDLRKKSEITKSRRSEYRSFRTISNNFELGLKVRSSSLSTREQKLLKYFGFDKKSRIDFLSNFSETISEQLDFFLFRAKNWKNCGFSFTRFFAGKLFLTRNLHGSLSQVSYNGWHNYDDSHT